MKMKIENTCECILHNGEIGKDFGDFETLPEKIGMGKNWKIENNKGNSHERELLGKIESTRYSKTDKTKTLNLLLNETGVDWIGRCIRRDALENSLRNSGKSDKPTSEYKKLVIQKNRGGKRTRVPSGTFQSDSKRSSKAKEISIERREIRKYRNK